MFQASVCMRRLCLHPLPCSAWWFCMRICCMSSVVCLQVGRFAHVLRGFLRSSKVCCIPMKIGTALFLRVCFLKQEGRAGHSSIQTRMASSSMKSMRMTVRQRACTRCTVRKRRNCRALLCSPYPRILPRTTMSVLLSAGLPRACRFLQIMGWREKLRRVFL